MSIIAVGSINQVKVEAVREIIQDYQIVANATVVSFSVPSEIADQPLSLKETILGAKNRARNVFAKIECAFGIGLESGLFEAPGTATGYLEACVCAIYDGKNYYLGLSSGFEVPPPILQLILQKKMDLNQASYHAEISNDPKLGSSTGLIGLLTKGKLSRKEYTKQSLTSAFIQIENASLYK